MVGCALLVGLLLGQGAMAPVGVAFHYERAGAFARVAQIRQMPVAWARIDGLASLPDCRYVNAARPWFVRARFWRGSGWGPWEVFQVADCSQARDVPMQRRRGLIIEVDLGSARRNGFAWRYGGAGKTRAQVSRPYR